MIAQSIKRAGHRNFVGATGCQIRDFDAYFRIGMLGAK